jgi:hypothetical protein
MEEVAPRSQEGDAAMTPEIGTYIHNCGGNSYWGGDGLVYIPGLMVLQNVKVVEWKGKWYAIG